MIDTRWHIGVGNLKIFTGEIGLRTACCPLTVIFQDELLNNQLRHQCEAMSIIAVLYAASEPFFRVAAV